VRLILYLLLLCACLTLIGIYAYRDLQRWGIEERLLSEVKTVDFPRATALNELAKRLVGEGVIDRQTYFSIWVRMFSDYSKFQAGTYRFEGYVSPYEVARKIINGDNYVPVVLEYTVPEGFTVRQIVDRLVAHGVGSKGEFDSLVRDPEFLSLVNVTASTLEGYLYPATYRFSKMPSAKEALTHMIETFWKKLPEGYEEDIKARDLNLEQAVSFASLIELETPNEREKPFVSEVIWRRLKDGVPLAIDAAIIYGIENYKGNITRKHLRDRKNKYNTRIHHGLPPSAIGSPSLSSLKAVLNPSNEGYYYYVLDAEDGSRHHFSKTLREHNNYVRKLVRDQKRMRIEERRQRRRQNKRDKKS